MIQAANPIAGRYTPLLLALFTTLAMVVIAWQRNSINALLMALPIALFTYWLLFSVGSEPFVTRMQRWCGNSLLRTLHLPLLLAVVLLLYVILNGGDPLRGNSWQIPLLFCAPAIYYYLFCQGEAITWRDIPGALLCVLPYGLRDYPFSSALPYGGGGIETLYLTFAIIIPVYALLVVRRLPLVGFVAYYSRDALWLVVKGGALFFVLVLAIGIPGGLIKWVGFEPLSPGVVIAILALLLRTFVGTALPEELIFRALFLNLLFQRLTQSGKWRAELYGAVLLLLLAAAAGYTTAAIAPWFPLLVASAMWLATLRYTQQHNDEAPRYTALLIIAILFGLLHYHIHSNLFMGLAMIAGWIYGYVYMRTGSVFYSALTHTLVNVSPLLLGFELIR